MYIPLSICEPPMLNEELSKPCPTYHKHQLRQVSAQSYPFEHTGCWRLVSGPKRPPCPGSGHPWSASSLAGGTGVVALQAVRSHYTAAG